MSDDNRGCLRWFLPCYDEFSLFLMSVSFLFVYFTNKDIQLQLYERVLSAPVILAALLLIFFAAGMTLSLYHAFSKRPKTEPEKLLMLYFAVIANYVAAIAAGIYIWREANGWLLILPALNIFYGIVPVVMGGAAVMDESYVLDDDVTPAELASGLVFLAGLLIFCQYYGQRLYWAITFSVCAAYATGLSRLVQNVVLKVRSFTRPQGE
jgi:hypothetical protein